MIRFPYAETARQIENPKLHRRFIEASRRAVTASPQDILRAITR